MKYSQAKQGRVFVVRLEDGDILHEEIENLAKKEKINAACLTAVGGADKNSALIVGPEHGRSEKINPMAHVLENVHEITGTGTIFPDDEGNPVLHMHAACGRKNSSITGCVRAGVKIWHVLEIVIIELTDCDSKRITDSATGFKLLQP